MRLFLGSPAASLQLRQFRTDLITAAVVRVITGARDAFYFFLTFQNQFRDFSSLAFPYKSDNMLIYFYRKLTVILGGLA